VNDLSIAGFRRAIKAVHDVDSVFEGRVHVLEKRDGVAWQGEVLVFGLLDHPSAPRCYVWEVDGEITAVLHDRLVRSPKDAVVAAILDAEKLEA
jgi:hypothetical protein